MDEIIKKIDEEIERLKTEEIYQLRHGSFEAAAHFKLQLTKVKRIKQIILSEQPEPITIGDKIRESNESLAEELQKTEQDALSGTTRITREKWIHYLNQPSTGD
jgi:hypothetical protein